MKRSVSVLIAAVLIISIILPCGVNAMDQYDEVFTSSDGLWNYVRLADGSVGLFSNVWGKSAYLGDETSVTVPSVRIRRIVDASTDESGSSASSAQAKPQSPAATASARSAARILSFFFILFSSL